MTDVLLLATRAAPDGSATALLPLGGSTVIDSLALSFRSLPVSSIVVICRPQWATDLRRRGFDVIESVDVGTDLAAIAQWPDDGVLVLAAADLVAHPSALNQIAGPRLARTIAAVTPVGPQPGVPTPSALARGDEFAQPVLRQRHRVVSVGTRFHEVTGANASFEGLLAIGPRDRDALVVACSAVAEIDPDETAGAYGAIGLVLLALVRSGVRVSAYPLRFMYAARVASAAEARGASAAVAAIDSDWAALLAARKEEEDIFATYAIATTSPRMVRLVARTNLSPSAVTWMSAAVGLFAALAFASGHRWLAVIGIVLQWASYYLDCVDGQLARFKHQFSRYGGWLDMVADRGKEYLMFAGLAVGGVREGERPAVMWGLATAAMVLQTVRHMIDTWYGAMQEEATAGLPIVPLDQRLDTLGARAAARSGGGIGSTLGRLSASADGRYRSPAYWAKRTAVLPIGERWMLVGLATAVFGPKIAFILLLSLGVLAFAYIVAGRTLRARSMRVPVLPKHDVTRQRDDGIVAGLLGRLVALPPLPVTLPGILAALVTLGFAVTGHGIPWWALLGCGVFALLAGLGAAASHAGALDWLVPAALRAVEYLVIIVAAVHGGVPYPLMFALLAGIVMFHYDLAGGIEKQASPLRGGWLAGGWDVRVIVLVVAAALGWATPVFAVVTAIVWGVVIVGSVVGWLSAPLTVPAREAKRVDANTLHG
jgi:phosphatidylglycerophosphate synthase